MRTGEGVRPAARPAEGAGRAAPRGGQPSPGGVRDRILEVLRKGGLSRLSPTGGSSFYSRFGIYTVLSFMSVAVSYLTIRMLTYRLSPEQNAYEGLVFSIVYFLNPALSFSATGLFTIKKVQLTADAFAQYKKKYYSLVFMSFLAALVISPVLLFAGTNVFLMGIFALALSYFAFFSETQNLEMIFENRQTLTGFMNLLLNALRYLSSILIVAFVSATWIGRMCALVLSEAVFLVIRTSVYGYRISFWAKVGRQDALEILRFGAPILASVIAAWITGEGGKIILLATFSLKEVGFFTIAAKIGLIISTINSSFISNIAPNLYAQFNAGRGRRALFKYLIPINGVLMLSCASVIVVGIFFPSILIDASFSAAIPIMILVAVSYYLSGISRVFSLPIEYYKDNVFRMVVLYVSAAASLAGSLLLLRRFGMLAPGIGMLLSYVVTTVLFILRSLKIMRANLTA
jgi:O-antigen/teichoic acid export membrane protein